MINSKSTFALMLFVCIVCVFAFTSGACRSRSDESKADVSVIENSGEDVENASETELSKDTSHIGVVSDADISNVETNYLYVWIDEEEMDRRFAEFKAGGEGSELNTEKYLWYFYQIDSVLQDYITINKFEDYLALFSKTVDITTASICEYYDISRQEYIDLYTERLREKGDVVMTGNYDFYRYDAIFSEEYWNHPDYLLSDYIPPEIDDYYTSLEDRNGYTRRYYIIDRLLIEFVGVDAFEEWLESVGDVRQNIVEFTEYFDITREVYDEVYRDTRIKPYNPDYLFGTPEEQEIYFTVHPLN